MSGSALAGLGVVGVAGLAGTQVAGADEAQKEGAALAKHTWEVKPDPIADIAEERDYDIVVVGAGHGRCRHGRGRRAQRCLGGRC